MSFENGDNLLSSVHDLIENHLAEPDFGVEKMAAQLSVHRSTLSRKIAEMTGLPPGELLEKARMEKSRELLEHTELTVSQISFNVGYSEASNFSRAFKRYYGKSPSEVRAEIK